MRPRLAKEFLRFVRERKTFRPILSKAMHVAHITWGYPSALLSHEGSFFANQAEALAKAGCSTVDVIAPLTWVPRPIAWCLPKWRDRLKIPIHYNRERVNIYRPRFMRIPASSVCNNDLLFLQGVIRRCLSRLRPDIAHVHGGNAFGLAGLGAAASLGIRSMLTLHGGDVYKTPLISRRHNNIFKRAIEMAACRIAVSADLASTAAKMTGLEVKHMPIGINLKRFAAIMPTMHRAAARTRFGLSQDQRIVLFVGNLLPAKGVRDLLNALNSVAAGILGVFAGEGPMAHEIRQHARAKLLGPVSYEEIPLLLRAADTLVLPSLSEGLGTVLVEAGASGIPAIGTAVGGIPSLLDDHRGYLVAANAPDELARTIMSVLTNTSESVKRAARFREFVMEHYDAGTNASRLVDIYKTVIAK